MGDVESLILFLQEKRKWVWAGVGGILALLILIFGLYFWDRGVSEEMTDKYYRANVGFGDRLKDFKDSMYRGDQPSDDEVKKVVKKYQEAGIFKTEGSLGFFSQFNLGLLHDSIGKYEEASRYFDDAIKYGGGFAMGFQAVLNQGHALFNLGYEAQKKKEYKKAIENYEQAFETYQSLEKRFSDSPNQLLSYRYQGLVSQKMGFCYASLKDFDKAKKMLEEGMSYYKKLLYFSKNHQDLQKDWRYGLRRPLEEDAMLGIRRIEIMKIKFKDLKKGDQKLEDALRQ